MYYVYALFASVLLIIVLFYYMCYVYCVPIFYRINNAFKKINKKKQARCSSWSKCWKKQQRKNYDSIKGQLTLSIILNKLCRKCTNTPWQILNIGNGHIKRAYDPCCNDFVEICPATKLSVAKGIVGGIKALK